jgi:hypothetical protein
MKRYERRRKMGKPAFAGRWDWDRFIALHFDSAHYGAREVADEFRPLIEAAREAVLGIPDGDEGDGSYWLGHLNYMQLKQALCDLGIEP